MSDRTRIQRQKGATSNVTNPSLTSSTTTSQADPTHSFSPQPNAALNQQAQEVPSNFLETLAADDQSFELEALKQQPLGHDISRISLRPQAKLAVSPPQDPKEQEADRVAKQVIRRPDSVMVTQEPGLRHSEPTYWSSCPNCSGVGAEATV